MSGLFTQVGNRSANSIAQFDGQQWFDKGIFTDLPVHVIQNLPDSQGECTIYAGGEIPWLKGIPNELSTTTTSEIAPPTESFG